MRAYRQRWQAVEEVEKLEARNASFELRWRQLNRLAGMARALGIYPIPGDDEVIVRTRWLRLKNIKS